MVRGKFEAQANSLCDLSAKRKVLLQLGLDGADLFVPVPHPEVLEVPRNTLFTDMG